MIISAIEKNISKIVKIILSNPRKKEYASKIVIRQLELKNQLQFQSEVIIKNQAFHYNFTEIAEYITPLLSQFRQVNVILVGESFCFLINKDGEIKMTKEKNNQEQAELTHNTKKEYILNEGDNLPFLIDLGVFTKENKVINGKYDKFKQINKFIEIIDDVFSKTNLKELTMLDFGCGKSYLSFAVYYYFKQIKNIDIKIIGYDLKEDVVEKCNQLAFKYKYTNMKFILADIKNATIEDNITAVITLHACDTATDYALDFAIKNKVPYIFSVPCCQHEVNATITAGGDFDILLDNGLIKERFSALLTDSIRERILQIEGYKTDMLEFVDFSHSPKNILIRAVKTPNKKTHLLKPLNELLKKYKIKHKLFELMKY